MTLTQLLQVFWARRKLFFGVMCTVILAVLVVGLVKPRAYVAEVSLVVDVKSNSEVLNGSREAPQFDASYLATQIDVIASHNVAVKVVDELKLRDNPQLRRQFNESTGGEGLMRDWVADKLLEKLVVKPSRESRVINVDFTSSNPQYAADVANAFASAYIATNLELKMDPARHQARWFDEQQLALRKKWEAAQERLSKYQQENNVVGNDGQLDIETAQLAAIARELVSAQSAMYDAKARQKQVDKKQLEQMPDVIGNGLLQIMKGELSRAESQLAEVEKHYGKNHPQYLGAAAAVESLKTKLDQELITANGSITQASRIAQQRTTELEQALVNQRNRILALKQQYDALDVLNREVQGAQHTYEAATQRGSEVRLESQLNQTSIAILNPAVVPRKTARSKLLMNLVMAALVGVILGTGTALCAELMDRRVRNESDIFEATGLTVLAELSLSSKTHVRQMLAVPIGIASVPTSNLLK
jgi:succinoglycan biosynthesis transport protein ExoP